jgi:hypothetical protein
MTTAMTSPTVAPPVLTCLPAPRHFLLRPQRLTCTLSLLKGEALTTAPGTERPRMCARCRRAAARWDTRLAALLDRLTRSLTGLSSCGDLPPAITHQSWSHKIPPMLICGTISAYTPVIGGISRHQPSRPREGYVDGCLYNHELGLIALVVKAKVPVGCFNLRVSLATWRLTESGCHL